MNYSKTSGIIAPENEATWPRGRRRRSAKSLFVGSNPTVASIYLIENNCDEGVEKNPFVFDNIFTVIYNAVYIQNDIITKIYR